MRVQLISEPTVVQSVHVIERAEDARAGAPVFDVPYDVVFDLEAAEARVAALKARLLAEARAVK